ncbi:YdbL family protein [Caulobacter sp. 73W]|uniref:YdbL family protein n=1 Tax=Caulobacter sp. 73W TaxID=3161137 RepID=A0AB39KNN0_9CAUL
MMRKLFTAAAIAASLGAASAPALAQSNAKAQVDIAKSAGVVGEQADGYLGFVSMGNSALQAAVREINAGRAGVYRDIAAKTGVTPEAAGQAAARQLFDRLPAGAWYKPAGGAWAKK